MSDERFDSPYPDGLPPHNQEPTSIAAAESVKDKATTMRSDVLHHLLRCGRHGATDHEIYAAFRAEARADSYRPRRRELVMLEQVFDSGKVRLTPTKRKAIVWVARKEWVEGAELGQGVLW